MSVIVVKKIVIRGFIILVVLAGYFLYTVNDYQVSGSIDLPILENPVTIDRDKLGIPYIHAQNLSDALKAQGFITAQDRLYQIELYKHLGQGKLSEFIGARGIKMDTLIRSVNIPGLAQKQVDILSDEARQFYLSYIEGINAFIAQNNEYPISMKLLDHQPKAWTLHDIIAIQFFQIWSSSANWKTELLTQQVIDKLGPEKALEIAMITINPDDNSMKVRELEPSIEGNTVTQTLAQTASTGLQIEQAWLDTFPEATSAASNAWATTKTKSTNGQAILVNSPHLDAKRTPGFWHPMGIFTPDFRAIGVAAPGTPGFGIARTNHIAFGATNGYSDGVDLYLEQLDPENENHYLEGDKSLPLVIRIEILRIKNKDVEGGFEEQELTIRHTRRGPLISDHGMALNDNRAISLRWATNASTLTSSMGTEKLIKSKNVEEARNAMKETSAPLSQIVVDKHGNIARISTGKVPLRLRGDGSKPFLITDSVDNWGGVIPVDEMPVDMNPEKNWVGTANHRLVKGDYPYEYSTYFSSSWRYRRIGEFIEGKEALSSNDHRNLVNDVKNLMAVRVVPYMTDALSADAQSSDINQILTQWNFVDDSDQIAPSIFQMVYLHFVRQVFTDELGQELVTKWIDMPYLWQERLLVMLADKNNTWFDDKSTDVIENRDDIFLRAALSAKVELTELLGKDQNNWQWGKLHTITFGSPIIPGKTAAKWFGGGTHPMNGSGETLNRGLYKYSKGFDTTIIDSVRFIADLSDPEKITAVIPGGTSGRYFDSHLHDQTEAWLSGGSFPFWFSDSKIKEHSVSQLTLTPEK